MKPKKRTTAAGDVRWDARVRVGNKVVGKTHRTRELATAWTRQTEDAARSGEWVDPSLARQTLADYAEGWLAGRKLKPRTRATYEDLLERRIGPDLGATQMRHLTPELVRKWWVGQPDGPYSAKAYRLLRSICTTAMDDGVLRRQPCRIEGAGKEATPERPLVTPDELAALVVAAEARARALILLAGWCGLRVGEVLALERRDFNLLKGTVRVERSVQWLKGKGRTVQSTKSDASDRVVTMPALVAEAVAAHLDAYVTAAPTSVFATGKSKRPVSPRTLWRWWDDAREVTGLGHVHFHDLRHAAGTMAAWTGATQKEIQAYLGHGSSAAAARYQHAAKDRGQDLADALDAIARGEHRRPTTIGSREGRAKGPGTGEAQADAG